MVSTLWTHQKEAIAAIKKTFETQSKCLVKMFCGSGKTLVYHTLIWAEMSGNVLIAFPSLALIEQYCLQYVADERVAAHLAVCSLGSCKVKTTLNPAVVTNFLAQSDPVKVLLVTYQSLETVISAIAADSTSRIELCVFDEAHHVHSAATTKHVAQLMANAACKFLFMTATPREGLDAGHVLKDCPLAYEYDHQRSAQDGICLPFEIRAEVVPSERCRNAAVLQMVLKTVVETGHNRVLTFHSRSNPGSTTASCVVEFAATPIPALPTGCRYKKVTLVGLTGESSDRQSVLSSFDSAADDEIFILASCQILGEGIDLRNANMVVMVDQKLSPISIVQSIGRITRKTAVKSGKPNTVLIPIDIQNEKDLMKLMFNGERLDEMLSGRCAMLRYLKTVKTFVKAIKAESCEAKSVIIKPSGIFSNAEIADWMGSCGYELCERMADPSVVDLIGRQCKLSPDIRAVMGCLTAGCNDWDGAPVESILELLAEELKLKIEVYQRSYEEKMTAYGSVHARVLRLFRDDLQKAWIPIKPTRERWCIEPVKFSKPIVYQNRRSYRMQLVHPMGKRDWDIILLRERASQRPPPSRIRRQ